MTILDSGFTSLGHPANTVRKASDKHA